MDRFKTSFLLLLVGLLLTFIPVVGLIGVIVEFVGLIFLFICWNDLGKSSLRNSGTYRSTYVWLKGIIILYFVSSIIVLAAGPELHIPAKVTGQGIAVLSLLLLFGWLKVARSIRALGKDLSSDNLQKMSEYLFMLGFVNTGLTILSSLFPTPIPNTSSNVISLLFSNQYSGLFPGGLQSALEICKLAFQVALVYMCYGIYSIARKVAV